MRRAYFLSVFYLIVALASGVFFREFTKFNNFTEATALGKVHGHAMMLGFMFFIMVVILCKTMKIQFTKGYNNFLIVYNIGLIILIATQIARGVLEVLGKDFAGLSHIAGMGHAILAVGLVWFMVLLNRVIKEW